MEEIFKSSLCFSLPFIISLTASLIVNLSLEFHTFPKCVFPLCLISSKPSVTQICNELALCQSKREKKSDIIFKKGTISTLISVRQKIEQRKCLAGLKGRKDRDGAHSFFPFPSFVYYALETWNPFVSHSHCILLAMQGLVWT